MQFSGAQTACSSAARRPLASSLPNNWFHVTRRVVPAGTRLRAFFVDSRGDAFLDLTSDVQSAHPGGSFGEALTVAALVNAVTTNLRAVRRVQLLVEGEEVETLAGHFDVSQPLGPDASLVVKPEPR